MSRVSQAQAQENRRRVVTAASQLFREQGVHSVSVADLMKSVGMTHGGFYKQFASKDALVAEAATRAFGDMRDLLAQFDETSADHAAARQALVDFYLSTEHRDNPGVGCPTAGFAHDMADSASPDEARRTHTDGAREFAQWLSDGEDDGLASLCTLVGAIVLARATAGSPLSEEILAAAHRAQTREHNPLEGKDT